MQYVSEAYSGLSTNTYVSMFRWNTSIKVFIPCGIAVFIPVDPSGSQKTPSYESTEIYTYLRSTLQVELKFRSVSFKQNNIPAYIKLFKQTSPQTFAFTHH